MKIEFPGQELRNKAFRTDFEQGAYLETQTRISEQICKYVVTLENLSVVRRPKKMTEKCDILQNLCEAFDNFS